MVNILNDFNIDCFLNRVSLFRIIILCCELFELLHKMFVVCQDVSQCIRDFVEIQFYNRLPDCFPDFSLSLVRDSSAISFNIGLNSVVGHTSV